MQKIPHDQLDIETSFPTYKINVRACCVINLA